ncbi:3-dehydroquinate synthase [Hymenobacter sp. 15J16-1T3B]|uniref:3-dehydroquinate synthase n=1 Tax=Hymenobacter sp. 15J16-1T3B TaxID=2886941 RepID=UPI001D12E65A|nr:3-dehydroquinate synthase [Hymenobacter sp. 15J16-1T3B]MCC3158710.1 3-dehydroquinate synthase [Hymenobacter sp. 15J16-1T3B]
MTDYLHLGPAALPALAAQLSRPGTTQVAVLADANTARLCYPELQPYLPAGHRLISIPAGEEHKTLETCQQVWTELTEHGFDRHSVLVCLGGGVVTDLGGFCAALYKRGLRCALVPTTLLAQVDAAIGGKTGVDYHGYKNHLGVFQLPEAVCIDTRFLGTLDPRELRAGYAEVVKHWLIADAGAFEQGRRQGLFVDDWLPVVEASVAVKQDIVQQDPTERGPRKLLNFGHTVGHALESYLLLQGRPILHGEAVAVGMVCEAWLSVQKGLLTPEELDKIETFLFTVFEKVQFILLETEAIAELARQDKKNQGEVINCTLLRGIGQGVYDQPVTLAELAASLRYYHRL